MRGIKYLWAFFPGTLIGLVCVPLALLGGGKVQVVRGCIEVHGGPVKRLLHRGVRPLGFRGAAAMTLGHVILGVDERCLFRSRDHEHVHVRQYERWGPFFLPAYFAASAIAWCRGQHPYLDNHFEREAYGAVP
ncbi:MAG: hypothetical protein M3552_12510 [Planctomycetota bacterium]|nr:hypothetical protein [Planctomycetota bacterium]